MLGTLNGGLEARGIKLGPDEIAADATGFMEVRDGLPVLTRIHVHYRLSVPEEAREKAERALSKHADKCPTAASFKGAIEVTFDADFF